MKKLISPLTILFFVILIISLVIKVISVNGYNFPFTMDQGRDLTDIRQMIVTQTPRLVGPTTSINGVLLGPFWYYFNTIPFIVSGGNPAAIVYWQIFWFQLSCLFLFFILKKNSHTLAFFVTSLLLLSPVGFNTARYFWNANSMPIFTILFFVSLLWSNSSKFKYSTLIVGLIAGLSMQIEAAFGVLFFPFLIIYYLFSKQKVKNILWSGIGFVVTLLPQVLFELRHGFIMTKVFISEFTGKGEMLGEKIKFSEKLVQRSEHLIDIVRHTNHLPENLVFIFSAIATVTFVYLLLSKKINKSVKDLSIITIIFVLFTFFFYLVFPQKLKIWYTLGFSVPIIFIDALFLDFLTRSKNTFIKILPALFIAATLILSLKAQNDYFKIMYQLSANNPSGMQNEIAAVDWVYKEASGQAFNLYSYLPSIYDYPYQHAFWWYGTQTYGYQPSDITYLPNQPEYIIDGNLAWTKKKTIGDNQLTFLIIEKDGELPMRAQAWLGHFSKLCLVKQHTFPWKTEVRMLTKCN
ncbi:MAG TPA: hypothetical protein VLH94_00245 [Spirochaetia bacterium]|nr:hypothetical protein [Spirochaetia bacterium]